MIFVAAFGKLLHVSKVSLPALKVIEGRWVCATKVNLEV